MDAYLDHARESLGPTFAEALDFLVLGGPSIWAIAALAVLTLALILWKTWRLFLAGAWRGGRRTSRAIDAWTAGRLAEAIALLDGRRNPRARVALTAMRSQLDPTLTQAGAESEAQRVAKSELARLRGGLKALELCSTIAPLLGLLGTVLGMIAAFQALQDAGARADPAALAGGIWEALLTTAAGMAVAIPASVGLTWFESVVERMRHNMEDAATRIFLRPVVADDPVAAPRAVAVHASQGRAMAAAE
ncbi:biopolymer transport protein [Puniceibacterium sp. IMCC21224]|nr:MotA/TolQ/ExbB proton channel family protein [Puniceibacterium sp. IMCC21224]KMK67005.1 biopolymer transport protein [Puniceibacterium sp. IMCC21224]